MNDQVEGRKKEIAALDSVYAALDGLDLGAQTRVLKYVAEAFGVDAYFGAAAMPPPPPNPRIEQPTQSSGAENPAAEAVAPELEGISSVGLKWIQRNKFTSEQLEKLFSLGGDEIDVILDPAALPGEKMKERMHNVLLLKAMASFLGSGSARVSDDQLRDACRDYSALDASNFASNIKSFSTEVSGTKESGYSLNPRGQTVATDLIKSIVRPT